MGEYPALDVSWSLRPDDDHIERLLAEVDGHHPTAVEERANGIRIYFSTPADRGRAAVHLIAADPTIECAPIDVPDEDWAVRSQASLTPVRVGELLIVPVMGDAPSSPSPFAPGPSLLQVFIRPSMGFGTGHHASTRLCLALLQRTGAAGKRVLDAGTGSGVLAIAAWRLGAAPVAAIDVDTDATASARENLTLNDAASGIDLHTTDVAEFCAASRVPFDVVLANLTGATLIRLAPHLVAAIGRSGRLIVSGVLASEESDVVIRFQSMGCGVIDRDAEEEWIGLTLTRSTSSIASTAPRSGQRRRAASKGRA